MYNKCSHLLFSLFILQVILVENYDSGPVVSWLRTMQREKKLRIETLQSLLNDRVLVTNKRQRFPIPSVNNAFIYHTYGNYLFNLFCNLPLDRSYGMGVGG